jgi:flavodoxin I
MPRIGIFYGSNTGNTRRIAKTIRKRFEDDTIAAPTNINKAGIADLEAYPLPILGTPTLGDGQLPGEFVDALGELYDCVIDRDAGLVGDWPIAGYAFKRSSALDRDNQKDQTEARVGAWLRAIAADFQLAV